VLAQYRMVNDERTCWRRSDTAGVLGGEIDEFDALYLNLGRSGAANNADTNATLPRAGVGVGGEGVRQSRLIGGQILGRVSPRRPTPGRG